MAARHPVAAALNPLRISGTALPPNLLLAAKLLALCYLLRGQLFRLPDGFLPIIPFLGYFNGSEPYRYALQVVLVVATLALWTNTLARTSCLAIGATLLLAIFSSESYYHNNLLYVGLFFVIVGLYDARLGSLTLRAQLAVVYLGAALNKLLEPDWRTGVFVQDWLQHFPTGYLYTQLAALLPGLTASALLSWLAIVTEFMLVPLLLVPRWVPLAVIVGVTYHTGLVLITAGSTFGMFWYAMMASYIALLHWPTEPVVSYHPERRRHRIAHAVLARGDPEKSMHWRPGPAGRLQIDTGVARFSGVAALARILLYTPVFYLACVLLFTLVDPYGRAAIPVVTYALVASIGYGYLPLITSSRRVPRTGAR